MITVDALSALVALVGAVEGYRVGDAPARAPGATYLRTVLDRKLSVGRASSSVIRTALGADTLRPPATIYPEASRRTFEGKAIDMLNIAVSSRSLAAARSVDPDVSPAAVRAAVEAALAEHTRQLGRQSDTAARPAPRRS